MTLEPLAGEQPPDGEEHRQSPGRRNTDRWRYVLTNWRNWMSVAAGIGFGALLIWGTRSSTTAQFTQAEANRIAAESRERDSQQREEIRKLQERLDLLQGDMVGGVAERARLAAEVAALQAQIEILGRRPVVPASTTTTRPPATTTTTRTSPTTTTSTSTTSTSTTTTTICVRRLLGRNCR